MYCNRIVASNYFDDRTLLVAGKGFYFNRSCLFFILEINNDYSSRFALLTISYTFVSLTGSTCLGGFSSKLSSNRPPSYFLFIRPGFKGEKSFGRYGVEMTHGKMFSSGAFSDLVFNVEKQQINGMNIIR